jgi:hypothetical protein
MHEKRHVSLHTGKARSKLTYQYIFADGQHRMQTYPFEELPLAQMPNYHNSNPYLLSNKKRVIIKKNRKNAKVKRQREKDMLKS